jgi:hypothetical protein
MTKVLRPFAAMVIALPLAIMARSITFPLTSSAFELGKSLTMFGGLPVRRAFSKSGVTPDFAVAMINLPLRD